jgi:hypothetical protein
MASGRLRLHSPVKPLPAVVDRWRYLQGSADVRKGLTLAQKLLSGAQLAYDLYSCGEAFGCGAVAFDFHGASPCQVWLVRLDEVQKSLSGNNLLNFG